MLDLKAMGVIPAFLLLGVLVATATGAAVGPEDAENLTDEVLDDAVDVPGDNAADVSMWAAIKKIVSLLVRLEERKLEREEKWQHFGELSAFSHTRLRRDADDNSTTSTAALPEDETSSATTPVQEVSTTTEKQSRRERRRKKKERKASGDDDCDGSSEKRRRGGRRRGCKSESGEKKKPRQGLIGGASGQGQKGQGGQEGQRQNPIMAGFGGKGKGKGGRRGGKQDGMFAQIQQVLAMRKQTTTPSPSAPKPTELPEQATTASGDSS